MNWFWNLLKILGVFIMLCILGFIAFARYIKDDMGVPM